jgi:hypothetical protein
MNNEIQNPIETVEEFGSADIKIKPDYYIHNAIIKAQAAIGNTDVKSGFLIFRIYVEQVEGLCRACKIIEKDEGEYKDKIEKYIKNLKDDDKSIKDAQIANKKLELLTEAIFSSGTIFDKLKA